MSHGIGKALSIIAALGMAGGGIAAGGAASAQERRAPAWQVDWGDQFCSLIRVPDRRSPFVTALRVVPGGSGLDLVLLRRGSAPLPNGISSIALTRSDTSYDVRPVIEEEDRLEFSGLPDGFWESFADAGELQLKARNDVRHRIELTGAQDAMRALRQCEAEVMREWGIDAAEWRSLQRRPTSTNLLGLRYTDYPGQALERSRSGRVLVRVAVSAEGRPSECVTVATSGDTSLDTATCQVVMSRGRFEPALDSAGQPVAARSIFKVTWLARS